MNPTIAPASKLASGLAGYLPRRWGADSEGHMQKYILGCNGCLISQGEFVPVNNRGGIIDLDGDWVLNHYGGDEGFLGWLILQTRFHRMDIQELEPHEAKSLGTNIQLVDRALREYWRIHFPDDRVQRLYVVYFHESVFGNTESSQPSHEWHLHIHLIPRTVRLGRLLRRYSCDGSIRAWSIPEVVALSEGDVPPEYRKNKENMSTLVTYLRGHLTGKGFGM